MPAGLPNMPNSKNPTMKTERTHEENQERAYIAASRRSDRSLEARVESARRASEIHKRRTGRALRVTEQDVLNEEMYEEEEDDLPLPYRQLTQHLTTGSAEFNRRLAAYLTNHVAVRSALDQIIRESHNLSATAAAAGASSYPMTGDFAMQSSAFSPATFAAPFHPSVPMTPDQSNPPTPSMAQQPHPQINMAQLQSSGTQFHIGPLGLSTVPQSQYPYMRRQTAPHLQIPQGQPNGVYQSLSPSQLQSLNQPQLQRRPQGDVGLQSPRSDTTMLSPQAARVAATNNDNILNTPEMLNARRMSMPAKVSASPVQISCSKLPVTSSSKASVSPAPVSSPSPVSIQPKKSQSAKTSPAQTPAAMLDTKPLSKAKSESPSLKRKASGDLRQDAPVKVAKQSDGRMSTKFIPSNLDLGPLDLSLPQNAQDLLYGGLNMTDLMNMSMMPGMTQMPAGGKLMKLDDGQLKGKPFVHLGPQLVSTPPLGKFGEGMQDGLNYFSNMQSSYPDGDYDLSSLMMETGGNTFGTSFSKLDPLEGGNVDELWQDFFSSDNFNNASQEPVSSQNQNIEASAP